jgi:carbamoyl-phosphate synthase large subunit
MTTPAHSVWLGSAGTVTAHAIARSIRGAWGAAVRIVAADINPPALVSSADLADVTEQVPLVAEREAFTAALRDGMRLHAVDTYVPLLVAEIALAAELRDAGALPGVRVLAPAAETARLCADKLLLAARLEAADLPVPPTRAAREAVWWPHGVVVKSRTGEGSRGVETITEPDALARAHARGDGAVAQRRCSGPEVTVDAFRSGRDHGFAAICRERLEVRAGVCTKARLFRDVELEAIVEAVMAELGLTGAACVQLMAGPDGWELTDVNPRSGGATAMSVAAGFDLPAAALADLWGEDPWPHLRPFTGEAHVVRSYVESIRPIT